MDEDNFPKISAPAIRALKNAGYDRLESLSGASEKELLKLHGFGPSALPVLREALAEKGMAMQRE